jgi:hypothetical protein
MGGGAWAVHRRMGCGCGTGGEVGLNESWTWAQPVGSNMKNRGAEVASGRDGPGWAQGFWPKPEKEMLLKFDLDNMINDFR